MTDGNPSRSTAIASAGDEIVAALEATIPRYLRALRRAVERAEGPGRLTMPQIRCLQAIAASPDGETLTSTLARQTNVSAPSISSMIDGLVDRLLVERRPDPDNRRQVRLLMTDEGRNLLRRYDGVVAHHLEGLLAPLSARGKRRLLHALADLTDLIDAHNAANDLRLED